MPKVFKVNFKILEKKTEPLSVCILEGEWPILPDQKKSRLPVYDKRPLEFVQTGQIWHDRKMKYLSRGPELVHNTLIHKQYGIQVGDSRKILQSDFYNGLRCYHFQALDGGRLKWGHFEMIRQTINKKLDIKSMFAIYRVPPLWQPFYKKGEQLCQM